MTNEGFCDLTLECDDIAGRSRSYRYSIHVPPGFDATRQWPALLFLHGLGESGTDGKLQLSVGLGPAIRKAPEAWPFVSLFPQKPTQRSEWDDHTPAVFAMLDRLLDDYPIDPDRVVVTGLSQGGHGCFRLATIAPERFAAVAPICGYVLPPQHRWLRRRHLQRWPDQQKSCGELQSLAQRARDLPFWIFHGEADLSVPVDLSQQAAHVLRDAGADVTLTIYPGIGHNSWDRAYRDGPLSQWLRDRRRSG